MNSIFKSVVPAVAKWQFTGEKFTHKGEFNVSRLLDGTLAINGVRIFSDLKLNEGDIFNNVEVSMLQEYAYHKDSENNNILMPTDKPQIARITKAW